jgi:uncharacterized protein YbbC (DUF1343 family)
MTGAIGTIVEVRHFRRSMAFGELGLSVWQSSLRRGDAKTALLSTVGASRVGTRRSIER